MSPPGVTQPVYSVACAEFAHTPNKNNAVIPTINFFMVSLLCYLGGHSAPQKYKYRREILGVYLMQIKRINYIAELGPQREGITLLY
jgi:hypothetical protein